MLPTRSDDAASLLERTWGRPVRLTDWHPVEPWSVARATVRIGTRDEDVVVKWVRSGTPEHPGFRVHPDQALREHATLRFVADLTELPAGPIVPRPIAVAGELQVMEDLSPRTPLHDLLLADPDEPALRGLEEMVDLLAALHAATRGREAEYAAYLPSSWSTARPAHDDPSGSAGPARHHAPVVLDVPGLGFRAGSAPRPDDDAVIELEDLTRRLVEPGELHALSNGDSAPGNVLVARGLPARLIDFESGGYQHALTDLASLYLPHPAWITATDPVATGLEQRYREAMATVAPVFGDDVGFGWELAAAMLAYAMVRLQRFETCDDRPPGDSSRLQRLVTTESAAALAGRRSAYPAIATWLHAVGAALRGRWPDTDLDISSLPEWLPRL